MRRVVLLILSYFFVISCAPGPRKIHGIESARNREILALKQTMIDQRDSWYNHGVDDGNGLLYQSTVGYIKIKKICTESELEGIDEEMQPWRSKDGGK